MAAVGHGTVWLALCPLPSQGPYEWRILQASLCLVDSPGLAPNAHPAAALTPLLQNPEPAEVQVGEGEAASALAIDFCK